MLSCLQQEKREDMLTKHVMKYLQKMLLYDIMDTPYRCHEWDPLGALELLRCPMVRLRSQLHGHWVALPGLKGACRFRVGL